MILILFKKKNMQKKKNIFLLLLGIFGHFGEIFAGNFRILLGGREIVMSIKRRRRMRMILRRIKEKDTDDKDNKVDKR